MPATILAPDRTHGALNGVFFLGAVSCLWCAICVCRFPLKSSKRRHKGTRGTPPNMSVILLLRLLCRFSDARRIVVHHIPSSTAVHLTHVGTRRNASSSAHQHFVSYCLTRYFGILFSWPVIVKMFARASPHQEGTDDKVDNLELPLDTQDCVT